ncbi:MAG: GspH/FimT family protein [Planctomycetes bacterium]|nr:GspH/FimT family protein [Planctomycetota bacterium]
MRRSTDRSRAGFSLLELAVALALITVASVLAIPAYYAQPSVTLDNASRLLARDLRYAQNEAALRGQGTQVHFDLFGQGYALECGEACPLPNPVGGGDLVRMYPRDAIFEGVHITRIEGPPQSVVSYDRHGLAEHEAHIELRYEDEVRVLHLEKDTGLMRIEGLHSHWTDDGQ